MAMKSLLVPVRNLRFNFSFEKESVPDLPVGEFWGLLGNDQCRIENKNLTLLERYLNDRMDEMCAFGGLD
jgi:hypothetical protein